MLLDRKLAIVAGSRIIDLNEPILGIPRISVDAVAGQVAVKVVSERLTGSIGNREM